MKLVIGLIEVACFSIVCFAQQSSQLAKPRPEFQKMAVYVGQWIYEGDVTSKIRLRASPGCISTIRT